MPSRVKLVSDASSMSWVWHYVMGMADSERQTWHEQFNRIDRESDKLDARVCAASRRLVIAPCQDFDRERVECSYRFQ